LSPAELIYINILIVCNPGHCVLGNFILALLSATELSVVHYIS